MGITQLNPLLQILFPDAVSYFDHEKGAPTASYDHILLDLNCLLYQLRAREQSDEDLILECLQYIDRLLQQVSPTSTLFLALDGPPPLGKILTSRSRRQNSTLHTLRFTPGTEFMHKLKDALILFAARYLHSSKLVKVIVSGSDREGEGEYKLFEYLHNLPLHEGYNFDSKHKNRCLVFGNDTDLLLFSLRLPSNFSVDFLRLNDRKRTLISVDAVKEKVLHGLKGDREKNIQDWIFLTLISGTDYTPRLGGFDYPKVYHHWRSVKMNPSNENFHIFEKISSQRGDNGISPAPKDSSSSLTSQHTIETSPWTSEYVLNLENLDKILQAANFPSIDREHLQIQTKNKLRDIRISQSDWKGNWNLMRQAFCSTLKIESITEPSGASSGEYVTKVYWTDPSTNKRHLAGEGHGVNAKTSEFFSSISCCLPTSSIMTQHISKQMSSNDYDRLSAAIVNLSFTQGSEKTTQQKISENENKNSTPYVFSADEKSRDRIAPFTKDSKVLEEHKEACEEFVKGVFWTFSTISAEIPNGRYFYPYTHTPTVFALQSYIAKAHQHSPTISISIGSHGIEKNEDEIEKKNVLVIPSTNYCEDAIPPVQFFATVTTSVSSANSALGEATQAIFKKTGELQAPVRPYYTLEKVEASSVKVSSRSGGYTPTYECIEMRDESKKFLENIRRACPPQAIVSMIAQLRSIRDGPSDESPFDSSTSLEELEPGLFRCEPSLVFFNYQLPDSATLEERNNLKTFIERNKETLDRWDQAVIDPKKLVERTHPLIKAWTGDDFAQIACFEEQKVHSIFGGSVDEDGKEKGAKEIGRKNEMRLTGQRPHFRPFNTPKTSFDKRWYHSHSRIGVTYTKQTKRKVASKSSAPPSHSTSSFRPNLSSLRTLLRR